MERYWRRHVDQGGCASWQCTSDILNELFGACRYVCCQRLSLLGARPLVLKQGQWESVGTKFSVPLCWSQPNHERFEASNVNREELSSRLG